MFLHKDNIEAEKEEKLCHVIQEGFHFSIPSLEQKDINELISIFDELKIIIDNFFPLTKEIETDFFQRIKARFIFETCRICGNTLKYNQVYDIIYNNIVFDSSNVREHLEIINQNEALNYLLSIINADLEINETKLKVLHSHLLRAINSKHAGLYRIREVQEVIATYTPVASKEVAIAMKKYFEFYNANKSEGIHPLIFGSIMHSKINAVRPFIEGNGMIARLFLNFVLIKNGYYLIEISGNAERKMEYYKCIEDLNKNGDKDKYLKFIIIEGIHSYLQHISTLICITKNMPESFEKKIFGTVMEEKILKIIT